MQVLEQKTKGHTQAFKDSNRFQGLDGQYHLALQSWAQLLNDQERTKANLAAQIHDAKVRGGFPRPVLGASGDLEGVVGFEHSEF